MNKKYILITLCFLTALSLVSCSPKQNEFKEEVDNFVENYNDAISTEDSLSKDLSLKCASGDLRNISEYYQKEKNKDSYNDILSNNITTEMFDLIYKYCLEDDIYEIQPDLLEFYKYESRNSNSSFNDVNSEPSQTTTNKSLDIPKELSIPDLPADFIECQKYIGQDVSTLGINTDQIDYSSYCQVIGKSALYGNHGTVSMHLGWDDKTITDITLRLDDDEYIQGDEYEEISSKLEQIFGNANNISNGITDYSGKTKYEFRLLRNGAGISWNAEEKTKFENQKPIEESQNADIIEPQKLEPQIGMTTDEIKNSTWGEPSAINKTTTQYSVSEQWVYKYGIEYRYIYFEDGIVTAIQE